MTLVTVIIPCHNCEKWVNRAIESVLAQSYPAIEVVLIENNSTDATLPPLNQFASAYPDKITVYREQKKGSGAARNLGLAKAKGEWIQFLDADDELLPSKIENQMTLVTANEPDLIIEDYRKIRMVEKNKNRPYQKLIQDIKSNDDRWLGLINSRLGITSSNLWKKEILLKVQGWKEDLISSQEYDLLFRLLRLNPKIIVNHQIQTLIYAQPESISRTDNSDKLYKLIINRYNLRCNIYKFLTENNLLTAAYKRDLSLYLFFHLLLISELNWPYFKEQVKTFDFNNINILDKVKILTEFIRNSSKRKYASSNIFLKTAEWNFFFFKSIPMLMF